MQPETKAQIQERVTTVVSLAKTVFHYGFIPTVLYLGYKKGSDEGLPPITILSLLWQ